jgi:hypothetical protein
MKEVLHPDVIIVILAFCTVWFFYRTNLPSALDALAKKLSEGRKD